MLVGRRQDWIDGERHAWEMLCGLSPDDVCRRAEATYDPVRGYSLDLFNTRVCISLTGRRITGDSPGAEFLLDELKSYSHLAILWYLARARAAPLAGRLISPGSLGDIFTRGTHVLPLDRLAGQYGNDLSGFLARGRELGGAPLDLADASVRLFPFPRVPVTLLLWRGDSEFPPRASLLFDGSCAVHLPLDIIWATAMLTILAVDGWPST
ncbi:MAG: DUF3786 domain-containing protein [Chloroflexi bacterium]|nr:DUF3786 domain-containing protein [Chloroflexota bacterium]